MTAALKGENPPEKTFLLIKAQSRPGAGFDFISNVLYAVEEVPQQKHNITDHDPREGGDEQCSVHGELGNKA